MKKKIIFGLMLILLCIGIVTPVYTISSGEPVSLPELSYQAFALAEAAPYELNLTAWAKLNNNCTTREEISQAGYQVLNHFFSGQKTAGQIENFEGMLSFKGEGMLADGLYLQAAVQTLVPAAGETQPAETYLLVSLLGTKISKEIVENNKAKFMELFSELGVKGEVSATLTGWYPGKMAATDQHGLISRIFNGLKGKQIEGITDQDMVSISGYTPLCQDKIEIDGKKINLNIATRYHEVDNRTYIYIGAPVINTEY